MVLVYIDWSVAEGASCWAIGKWGHAVRWLFLYGRRFDGLRPKS